MHRCLRLFAGIGLSLLVLCGSESPSFGQVAGSSGIHDPSRILEEDGRYYTFYTGSGVNSKYSDNLTFWQEGPDIFDDPPEWVDNIVPRPEQNENDFWAPSLFYHDGEYRVYYSASLFGSQTSAIGLVTNSTLDFTDDSYEWVDQGMVINSNGGSPYNAIDAGVFVDNDGRQWMTFGSFWNGVYITELDPEDGKRLSPGTPPMSIARNPDLSPNAIEAPYVHYRDGYYYLFVNWGSCCNGVDSTYQIRVGRSPNPTGPFLDRGPNPTNMVSGGGTLFLGSEGTMIGPGHMGIFSEDSIDYFGYHFYDATVNGAPRYNIERLAWTADGWPIPANEILSADFNGDSMVDLDDWDILATNHLADLSSYTPTQQALRGDLNGDGSNNYLDYRVFQDYYNAFHGEGALAAALSRVPEPASALLCVAGLPLVLRRPSRRS